MFQNHHPHQSNTQHHPAPPAQLHHPAPLCSNRIIPPPIHRALPFATTSPPPCLGNSFPFTYTVSMHRVTCTVCSTIVIDTLPRLICPFVDTLRLIISLGTRRRCSLLWHNFHVITVWKIKYTTFLFCVVKLYFYDGKEKLVQGGGGLEVGRRRSVVHDVRVALGGGVVRVVVLEHTNVSYWRYIN